MICDKCGKENRVGSNFCRYCGNNFSETFSGLGGKKLKLFKITWKSPMVLILISIIVLGGLAYGGSKAYAYYQVESKINIAKKLQAANDYKGSIDSLDGWENKVLTNSQKIRIDSMKADNQKFITYKTSFDRAVTAENSPTTAETSLSANLQGALKDLQSIDSSYPDFENVQNEMKKIQDTLVIALQNEADISKKAAADSAALAEKNRQAAADSAALAEKNRQAAAASAALAEKNRQAAAAAQAAKAQSEENAQRAQSAAAAEAANAAAQAEANRVEEVKKSFINQLSTSYNTFVTDARPTFSKAIGYLNAGDNYTAIALFGQVKATDSSVYQVALGLLTNFSNMPKNYTDAAYALGQASLYLDSATNSAIQSISVSYDTSTTTNYNSSQSTFYTNQVKSFLGY